MKEGIKMNVDKELLKGSIPIMVLKLFSNGDLYGYQIIKKLESLSHGVFLFKEGTLYPILHSLEKSSFIESYWQESEIGRKRRYYHITPHGAVYLNQKIDEWKFFSTTVDLILEGGNENDGN